MFHVKRDAPAAAAEIFGEQFDRAERYAEFLCTAKRTGSGTGTY